MLRQSDPSTFEDRDPAPGEREGESAPNALRDSAHGGERVTESACLLTRGAVTRHRTIELTELPPTFLPF